MKTQKQQENGENNGSQLEQSMESGVELQNPPASSIQKPLREHQKIDSSDLFANYQIQCPSKSPAFQFCCEDSCHASAVVCQDTNCDCYKNHNKCMSFFRVNKFYERFNSKVIKKTKQITDLIQNEVDKITDKVSEMTEILQKHLKKYGMNQSQQFILSCIDGSFTKGQKPFCLKLSGHQLSKFRDENQKSQSYWFNYSLQKFKNIVKQTKKQIQPYFEQINNVLSFHHAKNNPNLSNQTFRFFNDSLIVKKIQPTSPNFIDSSLNKLQQILHDNVEQIKSIQRIFSWNNLTGQPSRSFDIQQVSQKLEGKQNILFLVQKKNGLKFGAFSSAEFQLKNFPSNLKDHVSFIYSLDIDCYQKLTNQQFSRIYSLQNRQKICVKICVGEVFKSQQKQNKNGFMIQQLGCIFGNLARAEIIFSQKQTNQQIKQQFLRQARTQQPKSNQNTVGLFSGNTLESSEVAIIEIYKLECAPLLPVEKCKDNNRNSLFQSQGSQGLFFTGKEQTNGIFGTNGIFAQQPSSLPSLFGNNPNFLGKKN